MGFAEHMLLFRSATSARHWTSDHCIFCYILELRGLCFRRRVQIVYGPFNLQPVPGLEDVFRPYIFDSSKPSGIRRSPLMWIYTRKRQGQGRLDCRALMRAAEGSIVSRKE
jgi:hypothetical protein